MLSEGCNGNSTVKEREMWDGCFERGQWYGRFGKMRGMERGWEAGNEIGTMIVYCIIEPRLLEYRFEEVVSVRSGTPFRYINTLHYCNVSATDKPSRLLPVPGGNFRKFIVWYPFLI